MRLLERSIRESRTVDVEALCLVAGEKVWAIRVDVLVVDDAGNLSDAVSVAALAALTRFRRPDASVVGGRLTLHSMDEKQPTPLHLHHTPVCSTFATFDGGELWVLDPTLEEEEASDSLVSVCLDEFHQLCGVYKMGGSPVHPSLLMRLIALADGRVQEVLEKISGGTVEKAGQRGVKVGVGEEKRKAVGSGVEGAELFGVGLLGSGAPLSSEGRVVEEKRAPTIDVSHQPPSQAVDEEEEEAKAVKASAGTVSHAMEDDEDGSVGNAPTGAHKGRKR